MRMRPTRRTFISTMLAIAASPPFPRLAITGMQFHSVGIGCDVAECFYAGYDDGRAWEIVPAYDADQAIGLIVAKIRSYVASSASEWPPESEWEIGVTGSVVEAEVIASAKAWDISFDDAAARLMGWRFERDQQCEHCGLYSLDGAVPTCDECFRCKACIELGVGYYDGIKQYGACRECHQVMEDVK